jgi:hypothetical protein
MSSQGRQAASVAGLCSVRSVAHDLFGFAPLGKGGRRNSQRLGLNAKAE